MNVVEFEFCLPRLFTILGTLFAVAALVTGLAQRRGERS